MYNFIIENKWPILLVLEIFAWSATMFMFYARYKMKSQLWFKIASAILIGTGIIPQVFLGVINFVVTKEIDLFTIVIALLITYGFTIGKRHIKKLDAWAQRKL